MRVSFSWGSGHESIQLRVLTADGDDVKVTSARGEHVSPLGRVVNGQTLRICDDFVAYGGRPRWALTVLVNDPTNKPLRDFTVKTSYDDTIEPKKFEHLCKHETVDPNQLADFDKQLAIPLKA